MKQKISLGFFPTPLYELKNLSSLYNNYRIFIKRDDHNGVATGGNKIRKLEYLLYDALNKGCDTVITAGAQQSNHCRLTAASCARENLKCYLLLGGEKPAHYSGNLLLSQLLGAEIHFTGDNRKGEDIDDLVKELIKKGRKPYVIPYGGTNETGALGYVDAVAEMKEQLTEMKQTIDYIIFASSSGGTHAGLIAGSAINQLKSKLIGINIDKDETNGNALENIITDIVPKILNTYGIKPEIKRNDIHLLKDYDKAGYGVVTEHEKRAIKLLAESEGILLDPVYTARAFHGMIDLMERRVLKPGSNVLFLHTGGLPANFHYAENLYP
ncbi:D-cysteine desulfhydrase family protein [Mariniphaga sediminis]|uniref:D-cysteine desulfhydrase family protein n=1 Tax=Mariniphaga sediminis TaxID=1628158 RepID=A0A399D5S9_9BACT|nr:D-cysteine desulfhydrase family protein [Mariniphaga sediminis]RIH65790.1 D-cysteine desulfhydrase family protein [Mariniphaga sediminis]